MLAPRLGHRLRDTVGDDLLVVPTLPTAPPRWDELTGVDDRLRAIGRLTRLCAPVNSSALVAVSVPYGHDADGLPVSVQIVGGSESSILAAAECLSG